MSRCKSETVSLDSIKVVSDHLSERVKLDCYEDSVPFSNSGYKQSLYNFNNLKACKKFSDYTNKSNESGTMHTNNTNALMFRSMFFMNDEPRHFLAPHIGSMPDESEYLQQRKQLIQTNSPGPLVVASNGPSPQIDSKPVIEKPPKQRPHNCEECGKTFLMKHHLATHIRVHTGERPHVCPECGKTFALKHCLSTHLLLHSAERPYKCNECSKTFTLKHHLVSHEKIHTRDRPFECRECGQTFSQKRHLSTHLKFHAGERPFSCQVCGETFSREEHLVMHSRFHGGLQPYICPDCGAGFLRKFQLVEHERQHGRAPDACPSCGKEFLQKRTLLLHIRSCGLPVSPPNLSHLGVVHSVNQQPQPLQPISLPMKCCKECGESFSSAEGLALHQRLHIGDSSFISDICSLAASLKNATQGSHPALNAVAAIDSRQLTSNVGQVHHHSAAAIAATTIAKKAYPCPHCNRGFSQKNGVNQHMLRYPNGACKLKPFACPKCGKAFSQKNHLVLHERQHMEPEQRSELKNRMQNAQQRQAAAEAVRQQVQQAQQQAQQAQQAHQAIQQAHQAAQQVLQQAQQAQQAQQVLQQAQQAQAQQAIQQAQQAQAQQAIQQVQQAQQAQAQQAIQQTQQAQAQQAIQQVQQAQQAIQQVQQAQQQQAQQAIQQAQQAQQAIQQQQQQGNNGNGLATPVSPSGISSLQTGGMQNAGGIPNGAGNNSVSIPTTNGPPPHLGQSQASMIRHLDLSSVSRHTQHMMSPHDNTGQQDPQDTRQHLQALHNAQN